MANEKPKRQTVSVQLTLLLVILNNLMKLTRAGANLSANPRRSCINRLKSVRYYVRLEGIK